MVSTENRADLGYESPPGVIDNVARRGGDREAQGTQINEKSLRILAHRSPARRARRGVSPVPGRRAEPADLPRRSASGCGAAGPGWEEGDLQAFLKLGSDNDNFYLYRAPAKSTTWEPEFVIDLETFRRLRADIESRWLCGPAALGRGRLRHGRRRRLRGLRRTLPRARPRPRNQSAQSRGDPGDFGRHLSRGRRRSRPTRSSSGWTTSGSPSRCLRPAPPRRSTPGSPRPTSAASTIAYVRQNGQFRQINENPSYRGTDVLQLAGDLRLDRFLPTRLGLAVPLTVTYARTGSQSRAADGHRHPGRSARGPPQAGFAQHARWA